MLCAFYIFSDLVEFLNDFLSSVLFLFPSPRPYVWFPAHFYFLNVWKLWSSIPNLKPLWQFLNDLAIVLLFFLYDKYHDGYYLFVFFKILMNWRDSNLTGCFLDCVIPNPFRLVIWSTLTKSSVCERSSWVRIYTTKKIGWVPERLYSNMAPSTFPSKSSGCPHELSLQGLCYWGCP